MEGDVACLRDRGVFPDLQVVDATTRRHRVVLPGGAGDH
jgi:hypothetical protein